MRAVGVKILKDKLSEYVRLAAGGETVLVTDRDRVVAELGPPHPGRAIAVADDLLAQAVREGWVSPPLIGGGAHLNRAPGDRRREAPRHFIRKTPDRKNPGGLAAAGVPG